MKVIFLFLATFFSSLFIAQNSTINLEIEEVEYEQLFEKIRKKNDTVYLVNFWATWCIPCVKELPEFLKINKEYEAAHPFKMYLVSLDFVDKKETLLNPFIKKKNINAEVLLLNDNKRMNEWISLFDENWSGAIPATTVYKNGEKQFFIEGEMTEEELRNEINKNL